METAKSIKSDRAWRIGLAWRIAVGIAVIGVYLWIVGQAQIKKEDRLQSHNAEMIMRLNDLETKVKVLEERAK